jgi:hypothetical protein
VNYAQIWAELKIEPTSDARAIKRAYSTRLKTDRPDKDPTQFIALREAYEAALAYASKNVFREHPHTDPAQTQFKPAPSTLPPVSLPDIEHECEPEHELEHGPALRLVKPRTRENVDAERRAKRIYAQQDSLHPLLAALQRELQSQDNEKALLQIVHLILAHQNIQRFTSRDQAELELIHLLVSYPPKSSQVLQTMDSEFGWSRDHINLLRRCPDDGPALLQLLPDPDEKPAQKAPGPVKKDVHEIALRALDADGFNRWTELLFLDPSVRAQLDYLLNNPEAKIELTDERRQWWNKHLRLFPPINIWLSLLWEFIVVIVLKAQIEVGEISISYGLIIGAFFMLTIPVVGWLTVDIPLHYARQERGPFTPFWIVVAASVFIIPRIPETYAWWSPHILGVSGLLALLLLLLFRLPQRPLEQIRRYRYSIISALSLILIAAIFSFPQSVETLSWPIPLTLIILGYVLALTMMRLYRSAGNDVLIIFMMFSSCLAIMISTVTHTRSDTDLHLFENAKYIFLNLIWLSEATIYCCGANNSKLPFNREAVVVAALSIAALLLNLTPLPVELRLIMLFGLLLAGEYLAPLDPFTWLDKTEQLALLKKFGAKHKTHFLLLVAFELMFISAFVLSPAMPHEISRLPYVLLNAMVATRVLWFLFQHTPATFRILRKQVS